MEDLNSHISRLREDFSRGVLDENEVDADPSLQFQKWLGQAVAAAIPEVQAMNLSTVTAQGRPSSRIVYLREFGNNQFCFYTNYNSGKGRDLNANPYASITFFWKELERQVRIEGAVTKASSEQSDNYFNARPYDSKIGAWASNQSSELSSRAELDLKIDELKMRFSPENIVRPAHWGGYVLQADYYEFWQGRHSRLHDRLCYRKLNNAWKITRLSP